MVRIATASIEKRIDELASPTCYPDPPDTVEIVQTHVSVVCLAGATVYKLKKAVRLPFLDFSTVEARHRVCQDEVRLNRRLCPDVYLGIEALHDGPDGLAFGGQGPIVDWAVVMRRLPEDRMLDRLLRTDTVAPADMARLARMVAAFHATARADDEVRAAGKPERLAEWMRANFTESRALAGPCFTPSLHAALAARAEADIAELLPRLRARARRGLVVEGHGDLHARNICMTDPPTIYDCLEFDLGLRCGDVATENAFLAMDLRHRRHRELATAYVEAYIATSGDVGMREVLPPLIGYRAMVRAKVAALAAADPAIPAPDRAGARRSARSYLRLCASNAIESDGPLAILACGLPASGKSFVLQELAAETGWPCVATDRVRKELAGVPATARGPATIYTSEFSDLTYAEVLARGCAALTGSDARIVVLDGNFATRSRRTEAQRSIAASGGRVLVAWFTVDELTARARLRERADNESSVSDADLSVREALRARFEPPEADEGLAVVRVDGAAPLDDSLDRLLEPR
jgi:hypothetical protein